MNRLLLTLLAAGFLYAGRATALRYYQFHRTPGPPETIDWYLKPAHVPSADAVRAGVRRAGWSPGEDILLLAAASSMSPQDAKTLQDSLSYVLFPSHVWLATWCDPAASAAECGRSGAEPAAAAVSRRGVRRVLLIGETNPFPGADVGRISDVLAAVSLS